MSTIAEGLQEIKTLHKRIEKKREFIKNCLCRYNQMRDPHEKDGGSNLIIKKERQAIKDLEDNVIEIKLKIDAANANTSVKVCAEVRTIAEWLVWKRELAVKKKRFLELLQSSIQSVRNQAIQKGSSVVESDIKAAAMDIIINVNEMELANEIEQMENILSTLDGQLSVKNATVQI